MIFSKRIIFALSLLGVIFCSSSVNAEPVQCIFQKSATVEGKVIRLGDIVQFSEINETTRALAAIVVCDAPMPGERMLLHSGKVRNSMLRNHTIPQGTKWLGSGTVSVLRDGQRVEGSQILGYIDQYIRENSEELAPAKVRFLPKEMPQPLALPKGELECEVIPSRPGLLMSSRFSLIFRINGTTVKNLSVRGKIEAIAPVAVAKRTLQRGESITPDDFTFSDLDISRIRGAITNPEALVGKKMRSLLRAGQPLRATTLEQIPVISKGEPVKIIIRSASMLLTATGLALNNGGYNQIIRVQNSNSNKVLRAQVTGPGTVEIKI